MKKILYYKNENGGIKMSSFYWYNVSCFFLSLSLFLYIYIYIYIYKTKQNYVLILMLISLWKIYLMRNYLILYKLIWRVCVHVCIYIYIYICAHTHKTKTNYSNKKKLQIFTSLCDIIVKALLSLMEMKYDLDIFVRFTLLRGAVCVLNKICWNLPPQLWG